MRDYNVKEGMVKQFYRWALAGLMGLALAWPLSAVRAANLISNPSAEVASSNPALPFDWEQGRWGTNTAQFSYATTGQQGARSLRVDITAYSSGDAKWYFKPVAVAPNTQYTYSHYYQASVASVLVVVYFDAAGTASYVQLSAPAASSTWKQVSGTLTTPASARSMTLYHFINRVGWLATDNFALTSSATSTPTPTPTPTPTVSPTPTPTPVPTPSPTPTPLSK